MQQLLPRFWLRVSGSLPQSQDLVTRPGLYRVTSVIGTVAAEAVSRDLNGGDVSGAALIGRTGDPP